jgi:SAM-dependent methyltransferase
MSDKVDFDDYTSNYNTLLQQQTAFFSPNEEYFARYKVDIVRARVAAPVRRVLEFGCGIGRNVTFLQKAFPDAVICGYDISEASLVIAREENPGVEFVADVDALAGPYDLIFIAGVFHHVAVPERAGLAQTVSTLLAPAGNLFVFEHNPYNPVTRKIVSNCPYDADAVLLPPGELRGILATAGFAIEKSGYCLFVPPRLSLLAPLEQLLQWLPLGGQYWVHAGPAQMTTARP